MVRKEAVVWAIKQKSLWWNNWMGQIDHMDKDLPKYQALPLKPTTVIFADEANHFKMGVSWD